MRPILLKDKAAEAFALALHELATNAVKYGALSTLGGRLAVRWRILNASGGPRLTLEWLEQGVAMPPPGGAQRLRPSGHGARAALRA